MGLGVQLKGISSPPVYDLAATEEDQEEALLRKRIERQHGNPAAPRPAEAAAREAAACALSCLRALRLPASLPAIRTHSSAH